LLSHREAYAVEGGGEELGHIAECGRCFPGGVEPRGLAGSADSTRGCELRADQLDRASLDLVLRRVGSELGAGGIAEAVSLGRAGVGEDPSGDLWVTP
jgi:hypothetical protein